MQLLKFTTLGGTDLKVILANKDRAMGHSHSRELKLRTFGWVLHAGIVSKTCSAKGHLKTFITPKLTTFR